MKLTLLRTGDLETLSKWFVNESEVRQWAGPNVSYPVLAKNLFVEIDLESNRSFSLVENDELIGFGQLSLFENYDHLCRIVIRPDLRGRGFGKELVKQLMLQTNRGKGFSLFVDRRNGSAIQLYRSFDFRISTHPNANFEDCLFMVKD